MAEFEVVTSSELLLSPMRGERPEGQVLRVGAVQCEWVDDPVAMTARVRDGVTTAVSAGAAIVFLQEMTLSPNFCSSPDVDGALRAIARANPGVLPRRRAELLVPQVGS